MQPSDSIVAVPGPEASPEVLEQAGPTWFDEAVEVLRAFLQTALVLVLVTFVLFAFYYAFVVLAPVLAAGAVWLAARRGGARGRTA